MALPHPPAHPRQPRPNKDGGPPRPAADPALRAALLLLRWLLLAAVAALSFTAAPPQAHGIPPVALLAVFAVHSAVVSLAQLRRQPPALGPLAVAALDMLVLTALMRACGSPACPLAFLYPLVVVTVLLHLPTVPGLLTAGGVAAVAALPVITHDAWTWAAEDVQLLGFELALLLAVAVPVAMLGRYLRGRDEEMERQRFLTARLHLLNELMKAAAGAELDLHRAARTVAAVARDAVGGDAGIVALRDASEGHALEVWSAVHGPLSVAAAEVTPALGSALAGRPELVADAAGGPYAAVAKAVGLRSWVTAPLLAQGQVIGAVFVGSRLPCSYLLPAQEWLTTIAQQAAAPLANARTHAREKAYAAKAAALERTRTDFLLTASHELRTPLAALKIAAGLLAEQWDDAADSRARALIMSLGRNTERLERLVDELLDMARLHSGALALRRQPTNVALVLQEAAAALRPLAEASGQRIEVETGPGPCQVAADRRRLDQVFANLLSNAQKYSPAGAVIRASVQAADGGVLVQVRDQAPGIPDEERHRIFEAFYRVPGRINEGPGGLGLGLAIAKGIVALHGGRIWVECSSEWGNTFAVFLPVGDGDVEVGPHVRLDC